LGESSPSPGEALGETFPQPWGGPWGNFYVQAVRCLDNVLLKGYTKVSLITENADHLDVETIVNATRDSVAIYGSRYASAIAFEILTHHDVLISGASGFGRLAALLQAQTKASVRVVTNTPEHPFGYLLNTIGADQSAKEEVWADAATSLAGTPAILDLKARAETSAAFS